MGDLKEHLPAGQRPWYGPRLSSRCALAKHGIRRRIPTRRCWNQPGHTPIHPFLMAQHCIRLQVLRSRQLQPRQRLRFVRKCTKLVQRFFDARNLVKMPIGGLFYSTPSNSALVSICTDKLSKSHPFQRIHWGDYQPMNLVAWSFNPGLDGSRASMRRDLHPQAACTVRCSRRKPTA